MTSPRRLVVIGQGYVGLPLAVRAVEVGYDVVGLEADAGKVRRLAAADSYIEDISDAALRACLDAGRYHPTTDYADCDRFDVAVITVPTPLREGSPDLNHIVQAGTSLAPHLTPGCCVVLESTTYPGTTEEVLAPILERGSGLDVEEGFSLGYSPERIDPGNPTWGLVNTPKVVSGVGAASLAAVSAFYDSLVDQTVPVSSPKEAELSKLLENTFRHVNIALVNEMAMFARDLDVDVWETIDAAATKPFGFMRFTPGPGVGGHCLPIDPSYLSWRVRRQLGRSFRFVDLANDINEHMPDYVVQRATDCLNRERKSVNGSRVLLLGLSYKKNTGDARESPSVRIAQLLADMGATVRIADPHVQLDVMPLHPPLHAEHVPFEPEEVKAADLIVIVVDHDAFDWQLLEHSGCPVLDTRRVLPPSDCVTWL